MTEALTLSIGVILWLGTAGKKDPIFLSTIGWNQQCKEFCLTTDFIYPIKGSKYIFVLQNGDKWIILNYRHKPGERLVRLSGTIGRYISCWAVSTLCNKASSEENCLRFS